LRYAWFVVGQLFTEDSHFTDDTTLQAMVFAAAEHKSQKTLIEKGNCRAGKGLLGGRVGLPLI